MRVGRSLGRLVRGGSGWGAVSGPVTDGGSVPPWGADGTGGRRVSRTSHPAAGL